MGVSAKWQPYQEPTPSSSEASPPPAWLACPEKDTEEGGSSGRRHFSSEPSPPWSWPTSTHFSLERARRRGPSSLPTTTSASDPRSFHGVMETTPHSQLSHQRSPRWLRSVDEIPLGRWQPLSVPQLPRERSPRRLRGALNCPSAPGVMTLSPV